jgi:hypothetical protein
MRNIGYCVVAITVGIATALCCCRYCCFPVTSTHLITLYFALYSFPIELWRERLYKSRCESGHSSDAEGNG